MLAAGLGILATGMVFEVNGQLWAFAGVCLLVCSREKSASESCKEVLLVVGLVVGMAGA